MNGIKFIISNFLLTQNWVLFLLFLCHPGQPQEEYSLKYILGCTFGLTKSLQMEAQDVGTGRHVGLEAYYKIYPYLALGGGVSYTRIEGIIIQESMPKISLDMAQLKATARIKTGNNERNMYVFLDLSPGYTADVRENNSGSSQYKFKDYWGPLFEISTGTVMGAGMLKFSLMNLYLDRELINWFSFSVGFSI